MTRPKHSRRRRRPSSGPDHFEGETAEDLARALGIDGLTHDACVQGLFGELLEEMGLSSEVDDDEEPTIRVVQAGPGRRNTTEDK